MGSSSGRHHRSDSERTLDEPGGRNRAGKPALRPQDAHLVVLRLTVRGRLPRTADRRSAFTTTKSRSPASGGRRVASSILDIPAKKNAIERPGLLRGRHRRTAVPDRRILRHKSTPRRRNDYLLPLQYRGGLTPPDDRHVVAMAETVPATGDGLAAEITATIDDAAETRGGGRLVPHQHAGVRRATSVSALTTSRASVTEGVLASLHT